MRQMIEIFKRQYVARLAFMMDILLVDVSYMERDFVVGVQSEPGSSYRFIV